MAIVPNKKPARLLASALVGIALAAPNALAQERAATTFVADRVEGHLSQAARYEDRGDYDKAAQEYLKAQKAILELERQHPERRFVTGVSEQVEWGLERAIAARIRALPPKGLAVYRLAAEPRARLAYKLAARRFDLAGLRAVARRYPETAAAAEAEVALASWSLESGRVREAGALFLEQAGDGPAGYLRAAACYRAIGDAAGLARAARLMKTAGHDPAQHEVFAALPPRAVADRFEALPRPGRLTRVTELATPELSESLAEAAPDLLPYQIPVFDPAHPRFYVADSKTVRAFSARPKMEPLWNFSVASPDGEPERLEVSAFAPAVAGELVIATLNRNRPPRRVLKEVPEDKKAGPDKPEDEPKKDGEPEEDPDAQPGEKEDRKSKDPDDVFEFLRARNWRVIALDARTGLLRWDLAESEAFDEIARKAEWMSPPSVGPDGIYLTATLQNNSLQSVLIKVSTAGELLWTARLASRSPQNHRGLAGPLPPPLIVDGRVFVETSIGVMAAVDAGRGQVEWLHHYPVFPDRSQPTIVDEDRRIRVAPSIPARARGLVVSAPVDSPYILAFHQETGRLAWRLERGSAAFIADGPGDELILAGRRLTAVDRNTGRVLRQSAPLPSAATAPPLIDQESLLVPLKDRALRVGLADFAPGDELLTEGSPGRLARLDADHILAVRPRTAALIESPELAARALRALAAYDEHFEGGQMLERRGQLDAAEASFTKALDSRDARDDADLRLNALKARMRTRFALAELRLDAKRFVAFVSLSEKGLEDAAEAGELEARVRDDADPTLAIARARQLKRLGDVCGAHPAARYARKAADAYQALLSTADRLILNHGDDVDVDSHAYAALRLRELIRRHGPEVYTDHERAAVASATEARKANSSEQMRAVIDRYPVSRAAVDLRLDLAALYTKQRLHSLAGKTLEDFLAEHGEHPRAAEALAMLAQSCRARGRDLEARRALEELSSRYPQARVKDDDGQTTTALVFAERMGREIRAVSSPQAMTDDIHAAGLRTPLNRAFRIEADLDGINTRLVRPSPQQVFDLFLLRRGDTLEGRFPDTGAVSWRVDNISEFNDDRRPLPHDRLLLLPLRELIAAIDIQTGDLAWSYVPESKGPAPQDAVMALFGDGKRAYVLTADSRLVALDPTDGKVLWSRKEPGKLSGHCAARNGHLVLAINEPAALAFFDPESGEEIERVVLSQGVAGEHTHPLIVTADRIVTTTTERKTISLDPATRKLIFSVDVSDLGRVREVVVAKDESSLTLLGRQSIADKAALITVDTRDGSTLWTDDGSGAVGALRRAVSKAKITEIRCVDNALVTVRQQSMRSNEVWSQELDTGKRTWTWKMPEGQTAQTIIETPSQLFVPFGGQMSSCPIAILSKGNGRQVERPEVFGRKVIDAGVVHGTFLVLTDRGQFAFAHLDQAAIDRDIVEILDFIEEARKKGAVPAALTALLADRLQKAGRVDPAIEVLIRDLLDEDTNKAAYDRTYSQLCALLELKVEQQVPSLRIRRLTKPAQIDGELSDWWRGWSSFSMEGPRHVRPIQVEPNQTPGTWKGREDLSAKVYVAYDEKNLYFAVDVEDTDLRPFDSEADNWIGDCLLISIDSLNNGGNYYARDDLFLSLALTKPRKKKKNDQQQDGEKRNRPEGKYFVRHKDDRSGAIYECKIPWSMLTEKGAKIDKDAGPSKGFEFGFNITLTDDDGELDKQGKPRGALKSVSWTPGIRLHTRRNRLFQGYLPRFFGKIVID